VAGYVTLDGAGAFVWGSPENPVCEGRDGFDDVRAGAQVVITDAAGATVAVGHLRDGLASYAVAGDQVLATACKFLVAIEGVLAGKGFYGVAVTDRGSMAYDEAHLRDQALQLTLS
jgi:hypothetical protein